LLHHENDTRNRLDHQQGVSNHFDQRAKCTHFKLVGGQTTGDRDAEGVEGDWGKGMGRGCPPPQPTMEAWGSVVSSPGSQENEFSRILELEKYIPDTETEEEPPYPPAGGGPRVAQGPHVTYGKIFF